ncbi:MAG: rRNA maturation RNase YbeY [Alistipes sp.]|nr:rRNA maturation RNase YbeY [Alistipes sp.]
MSVNYYTEDCDFTFRGKGKTTAWIRQTAQQEGWRMGAVSIIFCSDPYLLEINRKYLQHDYFTDIITFDYGEAEQHTLSGDLMISLDTVRENAQQFGVTFENELQRVIIHGILHLCGHEDKTPQDFDRMKALENQYLAVFYAANPESPTPRSTQNPNRKS